MSFAQYFFHIFFLQKGYLLPLKGKVEMISFFCSFSLRTRSIIPRILPVYQDLLHFSFYHKLSDQCNITVSVLDQYFGYVG